MTNLLNSLRQLRRWLGNPRGASIGHGSYVVRPYAIPNRNGLSLGQRSYILKNAKINLICQYGNQTFTPRIQIGNDVHIGSEAFFAAVEEIVIEDGCVISDSVFINDSSHAMDPTAGLIMEQKILSRGRVHIGRNTFVGYRAAIMPGVTLGAHCVVGANSVVTHSFPDYTVLAGLPARPIGDSRKYIGI